MSGRGPKKYTVYTLSRVSAEQLTPIEIGGEAPLFTNLPLETVRKGTRVSSGASKSLPSGSEIELLGPVSSVFEASVRSLSGLLGNPYSARQNLIQIGPGQKAVACPNKRGGQHAM